MSGWLNFFENVIQCPHCRSKFLALFLEDGNCRVPPQVITLLASGSTICPVCNITIRDCDITDIALGSIHID